MNHLWAPWRSTYLKNKEDKGKCIFCAAAGGSDDAQSLVVHRGEFCFVILNRYPYSSGHLMVAPYQHVPRLGHLLQAATNEMMALVRRAEVVLQAAYNPDGLNLGMNLGEAAGAGIEQHIHMHVLPRWFGDANFMTSVGDVRVLPEALEDTYAKLTERFTPPTED